MTWGQVGAAGVGAVAGGLFGGGGQEHIGPGDMIPKWAKKDWMQAGGNIANLQDPTSYGGNWSAGVNPMLMKSWNQAGGFGGPNGIGGQAANTMMGSGNQALNFGLGGGMDYMSQLMGQGPSQFQYDQGTYNQVMNNLQPGLQGAYNAAMRDPTRQFEEQTLPGINMGAIGSGGQFGTKSFNQGAIAARGLQDRAADTASGLWQNAANQANQAAYGAGGLNLQSGQNLQNNLLSQFGNYAQLGSGMINQGYNMGRGNIDLLNQIGGQRQAYEQSVIDRNREQWNEQQNLPWQATQNRLNLYAGLSGGSQTPGVNTGFANVTNGLQLGAGLYNMFNQGGGGGYGYTGPGSYAQTPLVGPQSLAYQG
jgi:hypothetical protein